MQVDTTQHDSNRNSAAPKIDLYANGEEGLRAALERLRLQEEQAAQAPPKPLKVRKAI